jgi:hypothetical protein
VGVFQAARQCMIPPAERTGSSDERECGAAFACRGSCASSRTLGPKILSEQLKSWGRGPAVVRLNASPRFVADRRDGYLRSTLGEHPPAMSEFRFIAPCSPMPAKAVAAGAERAHEVISALGLTTRPSCASSSSAAGSTERFTCFARPCRAFALNLPSVRGTQSGLQGAATALHGGLR